MHLKAHFRLSLIFIGLLFLSLPVTITAKDFTIDEMEFTFKNTQTFDDDALGSALGIYEDDLLDIDKVTQGIAGLKKFYFDNGFFEMSVDTSFSFNNEEETASLKFIISENRQYRIDSIIYNGLDKLSPELSRRIYRIKKIEKNKFYNRILIIDQTNEILDRLQNNGYMYARLKQDSGTVIRKFSGNTNSGVKVILNFEGADTLSYFGRTEIVIMDNVYNVDKELLRREIQYNEGDIYSKEKKLLSERNIAKLAIVQSAHIDPDSASIMKVDMTANVKLGPKYEILPYIRGTSIQNHFYFGGGAEYTDKYFLGGGRVLSANIDGLFNSSDLNRLEVSGTFTQPHFIFNKSTFSNKLTVGFYNLEGFKNYYAGNLSTVKYFISDKTFYNSLYLDLNEELVQFRYDDTSSILNIFHSMITLTAVHDNTNNVLSPSAGYYHSISAGSAGLIPKLVISALPNFNYSQFVKFYTGNRIYFNLNKIIPFSIFATSLKVGDIIEYGTGTQLVPVQPIYKFFSGGSGSLRGWNAKENGILANKELGGNFLLEGSIELRKKLFPSKENFMKNINGALFIDYGNVWETSKQFRIDQIALATGFGFRYDLFFGAVRIDFGFKLYDPNDTNAKWLFSDPPKIFKSKFAIQFGIGEAF